MNKIDEVAMNAAVRGELGVKRGCHSVSLLDENREAVSFGENLDFGADGGDAGSANEDALKRRLFGRGRNRNIERQNGGVALIAVGIALDCDVQDAEAALRGMGDLPGEEDGSGTGAEYGLAPGKVRECVEKVVAVKEPEHRGGFAAGQNQPVQFGKPLGCFHQRRRGAGFFECGCVAFVVALQGEDADARRAGVGQGTFL